MAAYPFHITRNVFVAMVTKEAEWLQYKAKDQPPSEQAARLQRSYFPSHRLTFSSTIFLRDPYFSRDRRMIVSRLPCRFPIGGNVLPTKGSPSWPSANNFTQTS